MWSGASSFTKRSKTSSTTASQRPAGLSILLMTTITGRFERKGLLQHEIRLRHGPLGSVHEQERAVRHPEHALDLPAEIGVARRVDDVYQVALVKERAILGGDGDAPLPLQVHRVHQALLDNLVVPEQAALPEQLVYERCFTVIDVCYDRDIAYF